MEDFDTVYKSTVGVRHGVDPTVLRSLLESVHSEALRTPTDRAKLRDALLALARFLLSSVGRTPEYCWAVDCFFEDPEDRWRRRASHLPTDLKGILDEFRFLHGAVEQPTYHTTPEELLDIIGKIEVEC